MAETNRCDVVVVGAGFSGLSAALRLEEAGADVRVLEAQDQVGGRIRSIRRGDGLEEAGGATIGGGYRAVTDAARRYGVELIDATPMLAFFREQELVLNGEIIRQAEWPDHPANAFPDGDRHHMPWTYGRILTARHNPLPSPDVVDARAGKYDISMHEWLDGPGFARRRHRVGARHQYQLWTRCTRRIGADDAEPCGVFRGPTHPNAGGRSRLHGARRRTADP